MVAFLVSLLIAVAVSVVSYLLTPKPKTPKPDAARQQDEPIAEAGVERPVVFGTMLVTEPNCLWWGEKRLREYEVKA